MRFPRPRARFAVFATLALATLVATPAVLAYPDLTADQWREDLQYLAQELPQRHKNAFHTMTREQFDTAVNELHARIPTLAASAVVVELARIANMVQDGHSGLRLLSDPEIDFRAYPIRYYLFKDGLYVQRIAKSHEEAAGARVIKIGNASAADAIDAIREIVPRENEMNVKAWGPYLLHCPEVLHAVGLIDDMEAMTVTVDKDGQQQALRLTPTGSMRLTGHTWVEEATREVEWASARDGAAAPTPLWLRDPNNNFWFDYLEDSNTIYLQFNTVRDKPDETIEAFADRLFEFIDEHPVERLVIDVRWNTGGNNYLVRPLIRGVIKSDKIDQPGKLFVIIGRRTFSAAQNFVNRMENWTNVTFVGEPTGENVNMYGDTDKFRLPNSGITVRASYLWWQDMDPRDTRKWTAPHIAAELTSADYRANRDPAMEAILTHEPGTGLLQTLESLSAPEEFEAALEACRRYHADPANAYANVEALINQAGYALLADDRAGHAVEMFKLNLELHPESANAHDSLAEAYLLHGDRQLAIEHYEQAVRMDPDGAVGANATAQLARISSDSDG